MSIPVRLKRTDGKSLRGSRMKHSSGDHYALAVQPLPGAGPTFACVVSKKTAARAVDRNLAKRKCLSILRGALHGETRPLAFIVRIKPSALRAPHPELKEDLCSLLGRASGS